MKKRVILLGPPGAGKGTHAKSLTVAMHIPHISTGDMLRDARSRGTELGKQADSYMSSGSLVPDALVNGIVAERLACETNGYLLDGYPRTIAQAEMLNKILEKIGKKLDAVVFFDVPDEVVLERLTARMSCSKCGAIEKVNYTDVVDHAFENYLSNNNATCIADGTKTSKCNWCDETDTVVETSSLDTTPRVDSPSFSK